MRFETNTTDRKALAKAIGERIHEPVRYLYMPTCAYAIGPVRVERDGAITSVDDLIWPLLMPFIEENGWLPNIPDDDEEACDEAVEAEPEPEETRENDLETNITNDRVTIPMTEMTAPGMVSLLKMLYARQDLINAMTRSENLFIDEEVVDLLNDTKPDTPEKVSELLANEARCDMVRGVEFADSNLSVTLPYREETSTEWVAYAQLILALADKAAKAQHVSSKRVSPEETEMKYFCNIWLTQLGFGGADRKDMRRALMGHLKGYAAFRNSDKMEQFKTKMAEKRKEKKANEADR